MGVRVDLGQFIPKRAWKLVPGEVIWTDEECYVLNAHQHDNCRHAYTCGNNSRHRPLIATRFGWRCCDCDYTQANSHLDHGMELANGNASLAASPAAARDAAGERVVAVGE